MKVLYLTNGFPPHRWAGTERYTANLAVEMKKRGHQVDVICVADWDKGDHYFNGYSEDVFKFVNVRRLNLNWTKAYDPFAYLYNNPITASHLDTFLSETEPDFVHVTSCETLSASVLKVVKDAKLPLILTLTDFWFICPKINLYKSDSTVCDGITTPWDCLKCLLYKNKAYTLPKRLLNESVLAGLLLKLSKFRLLTRQKGLRGFIGDMSLRKEYLAKAITWPDVRITASKKMQEIFIRLYPNVSLSLLPYGHDLYWLNGDVPKKKSNRLRIGFIGQLVESKGPHILINAVKKLNREFQEKIALSMYGNVDQTVVFSKKLLGLVDKEPNITLCGIYAHSESEKIFAEIDVLVVPSLWLDFPLIIHEAFAAHTPVIASKLGDMAEIIQHNENGFLFSPGDVDELAQFLKQIVLEPKLLQKFRKNIPPVKTISEHVDDLLFLIK